MGMSQEAFDKTQKLSEELASVLRIASSEGHIGLAQTYTSDERFAKYYEAIAPGSAEFLCDAIRKHAK
ncbi:MAG: TipAS antibiotic-recognition domain-containing protein [Saccharofermentanales bacterium]